MSSMTEWISQATAAVSLARAFYSNTGPPAATGMPRGRWHVQRPGTPQRGLGHGGAAPRLLRGLARRAAAWRERRAVMSTLSGMSDRELADIALARFEICHVFDPEFARRHTREAADDPNERMLADLGLSRILPRPTAGGHDRPYDGRTSPTQEASMRTTLIAAAAALSLFAINAAHAGEGNGEPFLFRAPGLTALATLQTLAADTGSTAYPDLAGRPSRVVTAGAGLLPAAGSEGVVQTANALPRGAMEGTVTYTQARSVQRYLAQHEAAPVQMSRMAQMPASQPRG